MGCGYAGGKDSGMVSLTLRSLIMTWIRAQGLGEKEYLKTSRSPTSTPAL